MSDDTGRRFNPHADTIARRTPTEQHARTIDAEVDRLRAAYRTVYTGAAADPWRFADAPAIILDPSHLLAANGDNVAILADDLDAPVYVAALPEQLRPAAVIIPVLNATPTQRKTDRP